MKKKKKKGKHLDEQPNRQEAERRKFNHIFQEAYWARKNTDIVFSVMADGRIVTQKHLHMSVITQLSYGNKPSGCLNSTLIVQELAVKVCYLSFKILTQGHRNLSKLYTCIAPITCKQNFLQD